VTAEIRIHLTAPDPEDGVLWRHTDVDGDRLLVSTAEVPGHGRGVYFRTDRMGSGVPLADIPALIAVLTAAIEEPTQ